MWVWQAMQRPARVSLDQGAGWQLAQSTPVDDRLAVRFRPIMTRHCTVAGSGESPPSDDFPLANPRPYVPNWLTIDYRHGKWVGDFGYAG